jgi:DNA (cytosine-5)-methyltransferase 3A
LFFTFIEILEHIKSLNSKVLFLQENVGSASKLDVGIMSRALGVYPVRINSSLVTAQLRDRYYWSNIRTKETMFDVVTDIPQPKDRGIMFKDILESKITKFNKSDCLIENAYKDLYKDMDKFKAFILKKESEGFGRKNYVIEKNSNLLYQDNDKLKIKTNTIKGFDVVTENDCIDLSFPTSTTRRGRVTKGKSPCLMESVNNIMALDNYKVRNLTKTEFCRLQGFPDNYCDLLSLQKSISLLGDGWTLPIIEHIFSFI